MTRNELGASKINGLLSKPTLFGRGSPEGPGEPCYSDGSNGCESAAIFIEESKAALSVKSQPYNRLADNIFTFIEAAIALCILILVKTGLERL